MCMFMRFEQLLNFKVSIERKCTFFFDIKADMVIYKLCHRNKYSVYYSLKFNIIHTYSTLSFYTSNFSFICEVSDFRYIISFLKNWLQKKRLPNSSIFCHRPGVPKQFCGTACQFDFFQLAQLEQHFLVL